MSIIRLTNTNTKDVWTSNVTAQSVRNYSDTLGNILRLGDLHRVIATTLMTVTVLQGGGRRKSHVYLGSANYGTLTLSQKHSPYYMKLKLTLIFEGKRGSWSFPMIPEDVSAIQRREGRESN